MTTQKKLTAQSYSNVSVQHALQEAERLVRAALEDDRPYTVVDSSVTEEDGQYWYMLEVAYQ